MQFWWLYLAQNYQSEYIKCVKTTLDELDPSDLYTNQIRIVLESDSVWFKIRAAGTASGTQNVGITELRDHRYDPIQTIYSAPVKGLMHHPVNTRIQRVSNEGSFEFDE